MNLQKLREAEFLFLNSYPGGFADEGLQQITRRHNVGRLSEFAAEALQKRRFDRQAQVLEDIVRIVSRSSMVSMFEKPRFRDFVNGSSREERATLAAAYKRLLHGDQARGFTDLVDLLSDAGLAKWSLVTICPFHYRPERDVFVKPTTTKNVIRRFELDGLIYNPRPSWAFYSAYRDVIEAMKGAVSPALSPNNAAFTGFLMMTSAPATVG
jgi:hypothetical protein